MSDDDSDEMYSVTSSKTIYKRRSRASSVSTRDTEYRSLPKIQIESDSDEKYRSDAYLPVQKWAVDYNNKNYIRSQCNKNTGRHRKIKGQPLDWNVEYDNNYFTRSKVNAHKGLHRKIPEVKRKYVPDKDVLGDATGWEFDTGPEFDQIEQDVHYIPEGRIIARGCYRWYGVKRNDSDTDIKEKEHRENLLTHEMKKELKSDQEFLQSDVPYLTQPKDRKYVRGAYRHYEVQRNAYDIMPEELASAPHDPEWKRKYHSNGFRYLDLEMAKYDQDALREHYPIKGKPFRRTILNKVYELRKVRDPRETASRRGTRISLVPGKGGVYEGVPDRYPFRTKEAPSIRSIFKKKTERQKYKSSRMGDEYQEYEREDTERSYREDQEPEYETEDTERNYRQELGSEYEDRLHRMADRKRGQRRTSSYSEQDRDIAKTREERLQEYTYRVKSEDQSTPKRYSRTTSIRSLTDDKDSFEEQIDNQMQYNYHKKAKDRKESYRDEPYSQSDIVVEKRRNTTSEFDYNNHHLPRSKSNKSTKNHDYADHHTYGRKGSSRIVRYEENDFKDTVPERKESPKQLPPHVKERMRKIRTEMQRKIDQIDHKHKEHGDKIVSPDEQDHKIDLMKHKGHPKDSGQEHNSEYEKYVSKNGSELWIKKEEKYAELHHRDH